MIASLKSIEMIGLISSKYLKKQLYSQKHAYHAQIEALSLVKKDNEKIRHYALKVETLVKQGWYDEYPSTINLECNESFTWGLPKKLTDLLTNVKLNIFQVHLNLLFPSILF